MQNKIPGRLALAALWPFMLFVVSPLALYLGNIQEMDFPLAEVGLPATGLFIAGTAGIFLILTWLVPFSRTYHVTSGLFLGVAAATWVQSQLFIWDFGPLDGGEIDWGPWAIHMGLEGVVWLLLVGGGVWLGRRGSPAKTLVRLLWILGMVSVATGVATSRTELIRHLARQEQHLGPVLTFHPTRNVVVLLLDSFQSDLFERIRTEHPDEIQFLDGFVFYRNTMSRYPTTAPNIPAIMTGQAYKNEESFHDFKRNAYRDFYLVRAYAEQGYETHVLSAGPLYPDGVETGDVLSHHAYSIVAPWRKFVDYGLFRAVPTVFKGHVYDDGKWWLAFRGRGNYPPDYFGRDVRLLELIEQDASLGLDEAAGCFSWFHFTIPHPPWVVDENLQYDDNLKGSRGALRQMRGALRLTNRLLGKLRELGIYDSAEIVVMSDHGTRFVEPVAVAGVTSAVPGLVRSSAMALLLQKKPFSTGALRVDDAPLMNSDLACLLGMAAPRLDCAEVQAALSGQPRPRTFLAYKWQHKFWAADHMPPMMEYVVDGHVLDARAWRLGENLYRSGQATGDRK